MSCSGKWFAVLLAAVALTTSVEIAAARDDGTGGEKSKKTTRTAAAADGFSDVLPFVKKHHPQLSMLLGRLKKESPSEFAKAARDIEKFRSRYVRIKDRNPTAAAADLARWKVDSRIRLQTARMVALMQESSEGEEHPDYAAARETLKKLSEERVRLERDRLAREEKLLASRLKTVRANAEEIDADIDAAIERQFRSLERSVNSAAKKRGIKVTRTKTKSESKKTATSKKSTNSENTSKKPSKKIDEK